MNPLMTEYLGIVNISCQNTSDETGDRCISVRGEVYRDRHTELAGFISCTDCLKAVRHLSDRDLVMLVSGVKS